MKNCTIYVSFYQQAIKNELFVRTLWPPDNNVNFIYIITTVLAMGFFLSSYYYITLTHLHIYKYVMEIIMMYWLESQKRLIFHSSHGA